MYDNKLIIKKIGNISPIFLRYICRNLVYRKLLATIRLTLPLICSAGAVSEFAQALGTAMETHSANVRRLVDEFRSRSSDSRIDVGNMRRVWENLLRQVEADAASHLDLAAVLQQQLSRPTLESTFHRKLQSKKVSFRARKHPRDKRRVISPSRLW